MANTGLLPFVRGVDFSNNDFSNDKFPDAIRYMTGLQWLRLDKTNITEIPEELGKLMKLENLSLKKNDLEKLFGELTELKSLRSLNVRRNRVKSSGIPAELFKLEDLTTLDLSHNRLKEVPEGLDKAKSLLVLNLSHNKIESIPPTLFVQLTDLLFLDLSNNLLETLPPQTRRLVNLQTLILNDNPLGLFQLRQLPSLQSLVTLHMRNTQRTLANLPTSIDSLSNLSDVDLSKNALTKVPDALYSLLSLKRLNLSDNEITEVSAAIDNWVKLESLNLSRNKLTSLPASLCKLMHLRRLHVDDNQLDFEGIPSGVGKLSALEVFSAANNLLEMIPEGLCRCGSLKKLNLSCNKLITLPDAVHLLTDLQTLEVHGNPELVMPPKPVDRPKGSGVQYYNIDFSLQTQLQLAGAAAPKAAVEPNAKSDPLARKLRLRRGKAEAEGRDSAVILRGMQEQTNTQTHPESDYYPSSELKPKRWDESLEKPPLDYSEFFDEDTGQRPGLQVWEIENFIPAPLDEVAHGKFFEGDCYIVLKTSLSEQGQLAWEIHFWIGSKASLDKGACAAMHAVNLRNLLGARRTQRHEQGDEAPDFLALFPTPPVYIQGTNTPSGFFTVDDPHYETRLYRVHADGNSIHLEAVAVRAGELDPRYVFILDTGLAIYIWNGKKAKNTLKSKARLFAEKMNKEERKNKAELISEPAGKEPRAFWRLLGYDEDVPYVPQEHVPEDFKWCKGRLYRVELGMGYLELPQTEGLHRGALASRSVHVLDTGSHLYVWFGKKSSRLVRAAAVKLSQELFNMIPRGEHCAVIRLQEGTETQVFKTYFSGWEEVIAVDFTRTAESVARTGADLATWASRQETKTDLSALFTPRQPAVPLAEALALADEWNEDLEAMEAFVLEGRHFVRLPDHELGVFYSQDCYVFLCRYFMPAEAEEEPEGSAREEAAAEAAAEAEAEAEGAAWVVYFWQGRRAPNMGWLTFTFGLERKFKQLCKRLDVVRTHQQQESLKFMSHFHRKFIIKDGKRNAKPADGRRPVELYELRSNGSALCSRLVQVRADAASLHSAHCFILVVPLESSPGSGGGGVGEGAGGAGVAAQSSLVYVWVGGGADDDAARLVEAIAEDKFKDEYSTLQVITEGSEPENFFWVGLGGRKPYETSAEFLQHTRLFRCSNEKGYFTVSEKCTDFCQDDLADDDIMILDNGEQVFLWLGSNCSEVEIKLAYKSAQVYIQHLATVQPERPRKLFLTLKNKESRRFTKCFHGWGEHKRPPE